MKIKRPFLSFPSPALSLLLSPLQLPFLAVITARSAMYNIGILKSYAPKCRVISIGNLTLGGTGKTPLTQYTAKLLAKNNYHTAIISRGYGKLPAYATLTDDEAFDKIPTVTRLVGNNKVFLAEMAVEKFNPKFIILDDGYQSLYIKRNLNVLVIDALNPFGNRRLFPAGILREPPYAMRRADIIVLSHTDMATADTIASLKLEIAKHSQAPVACAIHKPECLVKPESNASLPMEFIKGKSVMAFCGIGNPDSFKKTLDSLGVNTVKFCPFPDHYTYDETDFTFLAETAREVKADIICTTTKDMPKLHSRTLLSALPVMALKISMDFTENRDLFHKMVLSL